MSTYVLVHGSFHGGWCWEKVVPSLVKAGHKVVAVDLPAHGEDKTPIAEVTLKSYVDTVLRVIDSRKEPVILVGHSFGGFVVSQVAEYRPDRIEALIYLTAFLPVNGQTSIQMVDPDSQVGANLIINEQEGWADVRAEAKPGIYYNDCSPEDVQFALSHLVVEPLRPNLEPVYLSPENFGRVPKFYIECLQDNAVTPGYQKFLYTQTPCQQVFTLNTGHSPFLSAPDELVSILLTAVAPAPAH